MELIVRNVAEIDGRDRKSLGRVLGRPLRDNQRPVIKIVDTAGASESGVVPDVIDPRCEMAMPEWCHVDRRLSNDHIAEVDRSILHIANLSRPSDESGHAPVDLASP